MTRWLWTLAALVAAMMVPVAAHAAGSEEPNWMQLGGATFNMTLYIGILVYFLRKPVVNFFSERRASLTSTIRAAEDAKAAAESLLRETEAKLASLDDERASILAEYREIGEKERNRIVASAEAEAAKIVRDAERLAELEARQARADLERRMVDAALAQAATELKKQLTPLSHAKLIDEGIEALAGSGRAEA